MTWTIGSGGSKISVGSENKRDPVDALALRRQGTAAGALLMPHAHGGRGGGCRGRGRRAGDGSGLRGLIQRIRMLEPPGTVVVEERPATGSWPTPCWPRVHRCAGQPELVARRCSRQARGTTPRARIYCLLAIDPHTTLHPLVALSPLVTELRSIARDEARLGQDQRRLSTGSARTCSPSSPPLCRSATVKTSISPPCCGSWPSGPPPRIDDGRPRRTGRPRPPWRAPNASPTGPGSAWHRAAGRP